MGVLADGWLDDAKELIDEDEVDGSYRSIVAAMLPRCHWRGEIGFIRLIQ